MRETKLPGKTAQFKASVIIMAVFICVGASANDGTDLRVNAKSSVPINYYEWIMVGIAFSYSLYLIIRAKRRNKNKGEVSEVEDV
jgi:hypothetical protein